MNYNWMPLSKAKNIMSEFTYVWWRESDWIAEEESRICWLEDVPLFEKVIVCRALVPEVPSFEEQSK